MTFTDSIKQGIGIIKLDRKTIAAVQKDKKNLWNAIYITAIAGALGGLGGALFNAGEFSAIITGAISAAIGLFIFAGLIQLFSMMFGAKGDYMDLLRVLGHGELISWLNIIPVIGGIASLWSLVMLTVTISEVKKVTIGKAFLIWFLPAIIIGIIVGLLFATLFATILAGAGLGAILAA